MKDGVKLSGNLKENGRIRMLNGFEGKVSDLAIKFHAFRCEQPSVVALLCIAVTQNTCKTRRKYSTVPRAWGRVSERTNEGSGARERSDQCGASE